VNRLNYIYFTLNCYIYFNRCYRWNTFTHKAPLTLPVLCLDSFTLDTLILRMLLGWVGPGRIWRNVLFNLLKILLIKKTNKNLLKKISRCWKPCFIWSC